MKKWKFGIAAVVLIAAGGGLWGYWWYSTLYPSTQDAYVRAHIVDISAEVTGLVSKVYVTENQKVAQGDPLFELDDEIYRNAATEAQAQLEIAKDQQAGLDRKAKAAKAAVKSTSTAAETAHAQLTRIRALFESGDVAQAALDQAKTAAAQADTARDTARAQLQQARDAATANKDAIVSDGAAYRMAEYNLAHTKITAPADGWVSNIRLRPGSSVTAHEPLFALVDASHWWIDANFKETDLPRIRPGQPATISVDMLPGVTLKGHVASIGRGSGSTFSLLPAENASGNWVKVTQRFPVRIALDKPDPGLRVGASSSVTVDTTADAK
ncbi:HlyD family secretion protein [Roseibium aggregatum]|uniref:HlyD family secretion protein n=1 Tax=Roseibium aggregatum TaxID=187304 RepID=A0A926S810_9HYPH|nr:HlyD family secretion protein [Roseibium aggregatum]MBD1548920.1 HlyD family secretion protein [Roseibium aggregatum]